MESDWVLGVPLRGPVGGLETGRAWRAGDQGGIPWRQFQGEWIENVGEGLQNRGARSVGKLNGETGQGEAE